MNGPMESAPNPATEATEKSGRADLPSLPDASIYPFSPVGTKTMLATPPPRETKGAAKAPDRGTMFGLLIMSDTDLVGIVAYGLYKHNKRDFLAAFEKGHGRLPDDPEIRAYMMGEETARRVTTYRHLAENFLAAHERIGVAGPAEPDGPAAVAVSPVKARPKTLVDFLGRRMARRDKRGSGWITAAYIAFLILLLVGIAFVIRNGLVPGGH